MIARVSGQVMHKGRGGGKWRMRLSLTPTWYRGFHNSQAHACHLIVDIFQWLTQNTVKKSMFPFLYFFLNYSSIEVKTHI